MSYIIKLTVILMVISGIAAGSLALVNSKTFPIIAEHKIKEQENARQEVMKEGAKFLLCDSASSLPYYRVYADENETELIGYIITAVGKGYSSDIETVTSLDTTFHIIGIKIISQKETPGLGTKSQEIIYGEKDPWFQRQFLKNYLENQGSQPLDALTLAVDKDGGQIHSITGATITSRAISNSIKNGAITLKEKLESK
jgi:Na+-translocating ferredoxin:NAD+ oxidoreductase subunit G